MKMYESATANARCMPMLPTFGRVDGRCFHSFTRGMDRPFDETFSACMIATATHLARETNACMAYTQSDEISLAWHSTDSKSQIWFDGRVHKMVSQLAAQATLAFYRAICTDLPAFMERRPTFDARVWQVPNRAEGANVFLWRELDATKNSISMAAHAHLSHSALWMKSGEEKQEMLFGKGINWNDYPDKFKRGVFIQRRSVDRPFSSAEIKSLPPRHEARSNPELIVTRSEWQVVDMPVFRKVTNREAVIFDGVDPQIS
jgi:tRNA(His) 5'-end guanylyltransferase